MAGTGATALSNTGRVRANNQDSAYAGQYLFVVADGMGGHAGGDIASALTIESIESLDHSYPDIEDAQVEFVNALLTTNDRLRAVVQDFPEITGMGTTVSGMIVVGSNAVIAHIGDSRIYRFRDGELTQITKDHTFVQRLVDAGRITEQEALVHPRRSVIMRVLGDVEAHPEIDTMVVDLKPGDRWLFCSDGLSGPVPKTEITEILESEVDRDHATAALIQAALNHGAPDNVTAIVLEPETPAAATPAIVGSVANVGTLARIRARFDGMATTSITTVDSSTSDAGKVHTPAAIYLEALMAERRRRTIRRRILAIIIVVLALAAIVFGAMAGYRWTQTQYYIGESQGTVAVFRGVNGSVGPWKLNHKVTNESFPTIRVEDLPFDVQTSVKNTVSVANLQDAQARLAALQREATQESDTTGPSLSPSASPSQSKGGN